jgi:RimJ/RimL family protein N-acetyltransferase
MLAETERLRIRGYRESDLDHLVAIFSDPRKRRGDPDAVVPESETKWRTALPAIVAKRLMFCILETKESGDWAGYVSLWAEGAAKNRTVMFSIALNREQEGKGYDAFLSIGPKATVPYSHHLCVRRDGGDAVDR